MKKKAFFITIEGLEGSGKSSVIEFLAKLLRGKGLSVKIYREPGSTKVGEKIRRILLDKKNGKLSSHTELLLYLAARTQLIQEKLIKDLSRYNVIICDRFFDSTLVYQGYGLRLGPIVEESVKMFSLGVKPDLTLVLDAPAAQGLSRIKKKDRIESRHLSFHKRLKKGYLALAKRYPRRIKVIDAGGNLSGIYLQVEKIVSQKTPFFRKKRKPKQFK